MSLETTKKTKGRLIWQWMHNKTEHRLVALADHTSGYEDKYIIEKLELSSLDEPQWNVVTSWRPKDRSQSSEVLQVDLLMSAIKSLVSKDPP